MLFRSSVLLVAGAVFAAALIGLFALTSSGERTSATTPDCRTVTGTPTSTGTPSPTPPFTPYLLQSICNDTGQVASDLHVVLFRPSNDDLPVIDNPEGCPRPAYAMTGVDGEGNYTIDVHWGVACVDPGEAVGLRFTAPCTTPSCDPPVIECFNWQVSELPVPSVSPANNPATCEPSLVTPTPTPTPLPTSCDARPTPTVTYPPTPYNPPPAPAGTNRDILLSSVASFCNDSGHAASSLRIHFASAYSWRNLGTNAPGCSLPQFKPVDSGYDEFDLIVDWGTPCVDPVESVTLDFTYFCGGACPGATPFCYTWFDLNDEPLDAGGSCPLIASILVWGHIDCQGSTGFLVGAIKTLRASAGLPYEPRKECPEANAPIAVGDFEGVWGDFDCDGLFNAKDALALLMLDVGFTPPQGVSCPDFGEQLVVSS